MADSATAGNTRAPRGEGRGFGRRDGDKGGRRPRPQKKEQEEEKWIPKTKIGRLVQAKMIDSLEKLYLFSVPIKEFQIIDYFLPPAAVPGGVLKDEVMKITPVQKQTSAGQRTRFKAYIVVGDSNGHVGLGVRCAKEVATAIRSAIIDAKLSVIPVRRGYWGNNIGLPHTVPCKLTGKCGSVRVRLVPAPRGAGIVAASVPKKFLQYAGIEDVYTNTTGSTKTAGNFVLATYAAVKNSYGFLTPDLWPQMRLPEVPAQQFSDFLSSAKAAIPLDKQQEDPVKPGPFILFEGNNQMEAL